MSAKSTRFVKLRPFMPRPRPISQGRIYCIHGVTAGPGGILRARSAPLSPRPSGGSPVFFEIRPFEKGRSLVLLTPRGLEQTRLSGPSARGSKILSCYVCEPI